MRTFGQCQNIQVDGDEYTSGFLGLHWFPTAGSSANKDHYERDTIAALTRLLKTWTGWCVINEIFYRRPRAMIINPFHPTPGDPVNAYASSTDLAAATMKETTALDGQGNIPAPGQPRVIGTGTGSDTIIAFSSSVFAGLPGPGATADEILLHEMVHGMRIMMGRSVRERVNGNPGMDNYEEFAAIVISNVYRSEVGLPQLRQDHHGFLPLASSLATSAAFKSAFNIYLMNMDVEQPRLCGNLRKGNIPFNPFQ